MNGPRILSLPGASNRSGVSRSSAADIVAAETIEGWGQRTSLLIPMEIENAPPGQGIPSLLLRMLHTSKEGVQTELGRAEVALSAVPLEERTDSKRKAKNAKESTGTTKTVSQINIDNDTNHFHHSLPYFFSAGGVV